MAVIIEPSITSQKQYWTKGWNWVTGPESAQSTYCSGLAGVIAALTILDILVRHHNITEESVTIALDGYTVMIESRSS